MELQLRLLVVFMWPRKLSGVRVKLGVGGRGRIIGGISLTRGQLGARVDDDDMALLEVFHQGMEILEVETAASVVAALWGTTIDCLATNGEPKSGVKRETHELVFAFHGRERVHDGASIRLYRGGYLSGIAEVGGTTKEKRGTRRTMSTRER